MKILSLLALFLALNPAHASQVSDAAVLMVVQSATNVGSTVYLKSQGIPPSGAVPSASNNAPVDPYQTQNQQSQKQAFMEEK